jgi:glycosyltransferase involved in cell wall biosynthesis
MKSDRLTAKQKLQQMSSQRTSWIDTDRYSPSKRHRTDNTFFLGYVGALEPENNVRLLASIEQELIDRGEQNFRFFMIGSGSEQAWLKENMQCGEFISAMWGESLARAYANFDLFIFPSSTQTGSEVVLEAQASGVPAIVHAQSHGAHLIQNNVSGVIAREEQDFVKAILRLRSQSELMWQMRYAARELVCTTEWEQVFEQLVLDQKPRLDRIEGQRRFHPSY